MYLVDLDIQSLSSARCTRIICWLIFLSFLVFFSYFLFLIFLAMSVCVRFVSLFFTSLRDWRVSCLCCCCCCCVPRLVRGEFRLCDAFQQWAMCSRFHQPWESQLPSERETESSAWQHFHHGPCDWRFVGAWRVFLALRVERYVLWAQWCGNSLVASNLGEGTKSNYTFVKLCWEVINGK